jgi:hypothetical protein
MNNDNSFIPIYIKLFERSNKSLEQLISDVESLSEECSLKDDVQLTQISRNEKNSSMIMVVYSVNTKPARQRHSNAVGVFLEAVFSQLADKHPSFAEPSSYISASAAATDPNLGTTE